MSFENALLREVLRSVDHLYGSGNWDEERFGKNYKDLAVPAIRATNSVLGKFHLALLPRQNFVGRVEELLGRYGDDLSDFYERLEDPASKELLLKLLCYRILGHHQVWLPLNNEQYWRYRRDVGSLARAAPPVKIGFQNWKLRLFDVEPLGYPIRVYSVPIGIVEQFFMGHYAHAKGAVTVRAEEGDHVIDAGGCWGETALFFAHAVGPQGKVYTFEFVPENLAVMEKNFALNPELSSRVVISRQPLWHTPDLALSFSSQGPGSKLRNSVDPAGTTLTSTIDACMAQGMAPRVDFVKMDIEGAELPALQGAVETIRKFKPKLAISVYHNSLEDFARIPSFLSGIGVPYRFFLSHATIHEEETVLFAAPS